VEVSTAGALTVHGLIPTAEQDLPPLVLADDLNHELPLPEHCVVLLLKADGDFVEGQSLPQVPGNIVRDGYVLHSIPVAGRSLWNIRRAEAGATITVRGKLLLAE
jgi:hypothetical protein